MSPAAHRGLLRFHAKLLHIKRGYLSIANHGLLLALQPSPPGLDPRHCDLSYQRRLRSLEGQGLRTESICILTTLQEHTIDKGPEPGATRLEVGPRESRAGSRVPRHTSSSPVVQATCQGGAVHAPGAPPGGEPPPTHQWKHHAPCWLTTLPRSGYARTHTVALCSALVINN